METPFLVKYPSYPAPHVWGHRMVQTISYPSCIPLNPTNSTNSPSLPHWIGYMSTYIYNKRSISGYISLSWLLCIYIYIQTPFKPHESPLHPITLVIYPCPMKIPHCIEIHPRTRKLRTDKSLMSSEADLKLARLQVFAETWWAIHLLAWMETQNPWKPLLFTS